MSTCLLLPFEEYSNPRLQCRQGDVDMGITGEDIVAESDVKASSCKPKVHVGVNIADRPITPSSHAYGLPPSHHHMSASLFLRDLSHVPLVPPAYPLPAPLMPAYFLQAVGVLRHGTPLSLSTQQQLSQQQLSHQRQPSSQQQLPQQQAQTRMPHYVSPIPCTKSLPCLHP